MSRMASFIWVESWLPLLSPAARSQQVERLGSDIFFRFVYLNYILVSSAYLLTADDMLKYRLCR